MTGEKLKFVELRAKGLSFDKVAKELGKSKQTLINWEAELKLDISNLKAIELETLYEVFLITKENRIQRLGEVLSRVETELEGRDLTDISTEKLFTLLLKYNKVIADEIIEPKFMSDQEIKGKKMIKNLSNQLGN